MIYCHLPSKKPLNMLELLETCTYMGQDIELMGESL